jgi:hypothetical protein
MGFPANTVIQCSLREIYSYPGAEQFEMRSEIIFLACLAPDVPSITAFGPIAKFGSEFSMTGVESLQTTHCLETPWRGLRNPGQLRPRHGSNRASEDTVRQIKLKLLHLNVPAMLCNARNCFPAHCWRGFTRAFHLLQKRVRQRRRTARVQPHIKIPLGVPRANFLHVRIALDDLIANSGAFGRAITMLVINANSSFALVMPQASACGRACKTKGGCAIHAQHLSSPGACAGASSQSPCWSPPWSRQSSGPSNCAG